MTMTFDMPWCTVCGQLARGMLEIVPGLALLNFDNAGRAEYEGETKIAWDDQLPCRDRQGRLTLQCPDGHQWQAQLLDERRTPPAGGLVPHTASPDTPRYLLRVDNTLLQQQRRLLRRLMESAHQCKVFIPGAKTARLLAGGGTLLDDIADQAHDHREIDDP